MIEEFKKDVLEGLSKVNKTLPSKYFYDKKGDKLFQQIMKLPEYYLTRSEMEIFSTKASEIVHSFGMSKTEKFELIELGAGDGTKTIKLLNQLLIENYNFEYIPIDISKNALEGLEGMLNKELPNLRISLMQGSYFNTLSKIKERNQPKVILFLGSNLGNLQDKEANKFLYELGSGMRKGDKILIGLDKIKAKEIVLPAYNDKQGITREFNLNILDRINRELGGDFDRKQFEHTPEYDENEGIAKSYIVSKIDQQVEIASLNESFVFSKGEKIHTEISRKYSEQILHKILKSTDLKIEKIHQGANGYFMDTILIKN